ncbi:glycogen debranching protein GlgX [Allomesorhizobium camelthorni]|uniref:Glycogen debranching protein GlgX n=1 Tax=Allomesorhizobium camelthorni TaxID=475069 RepID=A0A6G4WC07_9HYPH|nr:glycogen debranching protein GlgX [Mesorhizobium camelthorni]NGO52301.1 glycogen debranching protein GlgX [Mesorhizobium camelthorni]
MNFRLPLGAIPAADGIRFSVWSGVAVRLWVSIFDGTGDREIERLELLPEGDGVFALTVPGLNAGTRYGFRADGEYAPERGLWFDPAKLLMDPYAVSIDRPYVFDPRLSAGRGEGVDTAPLMPKAVALELPQPIAAKPPLFRPGELIYEVAVRAFTMRHPAVPEAQRGTIAALAHPAVIEHLSKLGVSAVELMPVVAWIDERHLPPLGLTNAWGYNPVSFMALDPRLAPGGIAELRDTVAALREAGIGVILDLVFNHTGESDELGPTLSLRGLDNQAYYRHRPGNSGKLVNQTGTGNTIACDHPAARQLILDTLRHFVLHAGVDGVRFDLATVLGRADDGFDPNAALLAAIRNDPVLRDRILIAEPWDIGPGGYQLGNFPTPFLEWNDKYRDDIRRFWRGDRGMIGALATRLAGSSDVFAGEGVAGTRSVNFIAAHDGMTLADIVRYERKHNEANGEQNRDGHDENLSWNNGVEGETDDPDIDARRRADVLAMLSTLFASRGTIMLTAGDEFGRTQLGNNNAYAQDNDLTWLDWSGRDRKIEGHVAALSAMRRSVAALRDVDFLSGDAQDGFRDVEWLDETGQPLDERGWSDPERRRLSMVLDDRPGGRFAAAFNGSITPAEFALPVRAGFQWSAAPGLPATIRDSVVLVPGRSVVFVVQRGAPQR